MKPAKVLIYFAVLVALAAYVYFVEIKHKAKVQEAEKLAKKIVHVDKDSVVKLELIHGDQTKVKVDKIADTWMVSDPVKTKADKDAISSLLHSISDAEPEKVIQEKDVKWDEYGLDKPEFTVAFATKDERFKLAFGASNPSKTSYYLRFGEEPKLFLVADTLKNSLNKGLFDLREKSVFGIADTDVERIVIADKGKELELERKDPTRWVVSRPESFGAKQSLVSTNLRTLTNLKAKDIIDEPIEQDDPYGLEKPEGSIVLSGPKLEQTLLLGRAMEKDGVSAPAPDRYARLKGDKTVYVLEGRTLKGLKTEPSELRDRSVLSFNPAEIERFEIDLDGKQWAAVQDKDKNWAIEKPEKQTKVDAWPITGVLWDLKDLEWKSLTKPIPANLGPLHLDTPRLVVSLFKKGEKQPITLKVGWDKPTVKTKEQIEGTKTQEAAMPAPTTKPDAESKPAEVTQEEAAAPTTLNALAQPAAEDGAVFVLDGIFLTRLQGDLQRWTQPKQQ